MGALVTKALRPFKSFNIENRAHRVISKEKPTPAPRYQQAIDDMRRAMDKDPKLNEKLNTKDAELDKMLKDVYVTSEGKPEEDITREIQQKNPNRPLPMYRMQPEDYEYGFKEPDQISYGRVTLRKALEFLAAHQSNPNEVTPEKIAQEYKLKLDDVNNVIKYFKTFEIFVPETKTAPATFAGPASLRKQMERAFEMKQIEDKKKLEPKDPLDEFEKLTPKHRIKNDER
ncbi:protein NDUFAF4 homolog [Hyposmocoma kahamanoa]|uniref:protein NDUFAF4 homolog n=1 Tax=Hyposmocoma kahamanoa TaxID=1477025 RepID=UPI000E6D8D20|nr:protein NDUFAF4 homolog [Hyposmocoma kahamanoa]